MKKNFENLYKDLENNNAKNFKEISNKMKEENRKKYNIYFICYNNGYVHNIFL